MQIERKYYLSLRERNLRETKISRLPSDRKLEETTGDQKNTKSVILLHAPMTYSDLSKSETLLKRDQNR